MAQSALNPTSQAISELVAEDDELRARLRRLVLAAIRDAEYTMQWGTPSEKAALTKSLVPSMMRTLSTVTNEDNQDEEAAYKRMMAQLRGESQ